MDTQHLGMCESQGMIPLSVGQEPDEDGIGEDIILRQGYASIRINIAQVDELHKILGRWLWE